MSVGGRSGCASRDWTSSWSFGWASSLFFVYNWVCLCGDLCWNECVVRCSSQARFAVAEYAGQQSRGTSEGVVAESCFIASVGRESFKGSMNRVVWRRESASETRRAGRAKVSGRRRGLALTHASSHESLQWQSFKGTIGEEERRLIMVDNEGAECDIFVCICTTRYCQT